MSTKNRKKSSKQKASLASKVMRDPKASKIEKSFAASVLSQASSDKETGEKMETRAAKALQSENSSEILKKLAGSLVSQSSLAR